MSGGSLYLNGGSLAEHRLHSSPWERNCLYPLCFLFLVAMTLLALALVMVNILALVISPAERLSVQVSLLAVPSTCVCNSIASNCLGMSGTVPDL